MKSFFLPFAALSICAALSSCSGNGGSMSVAASDTLLTVDELFRDPLAFVGDTIRVHGVCTQLTGDGDSRALLSSPDGQTSLQLHATSEVDGDFSPDCVGQPMQARGVLCETKVGRAQIDSLERQYMLQLEKEAAEGKPVRKNHEKPSSHKPADLKSEAAAEGFDTVTSKAQQLANMRHQIEQRLEKEGKDYISLFYLNTISYKVRE